jgi:hypothetical protein
LRSRPSPCWRRSSARCVASDYSTSFSDNVGCALGCCCGEVSVDAPAFAYSYPATSSEPTTEATISAAHPAMPNASITSAPTANHFLMTFFLVAARRQATLLDVRGATSLDHSQPSAQLVHVPVASVRLTIESFLIIEIEQHRGGALRAVWYRASCDIAAWRDFDRHLWYLVHEFSRCWSRRHSRPSH